MSESMEVERNLAERLKAGAIANWDRDLAMAREWFPVEEEVAIAGVREPACHDVGFAP